MPIIKDNMTYIQSIREAEDKIIRGAYERLKKSPEYKRRGVMGRLYMMCLELDVTHTRLIPKLKRNGIDLSIGAPASDYGAGRTPKILSRTRTA